MADVHIVEVDERDSTWEDHNPRFRVFLHRSQEANTFGATIAYDLTGVDVLQVIDWAQRHVQANDTYAIALVVDDEPRGATPAEGDRGLVWLVGTDGTNSYPDEPVAGAQRRMLARRVEPVGIPAEDRMPDAVPPAALG